MEVEVGESLIVRVKPGMATETILNSYQDWKIPGKVIAIIPAADRGKATVKVRVGLDARNDPRIVPEMGVRVGFLEAPQPAQAQAKAGVLAPTAAITSRGNADVAFVLEGDAVRQRTLTLGRELGDDREVLSGLAGGDTLVRDPPDTRADGARVRVADDDGNAD